MNVWRQCALFPLRSFHGRVVDYSAVLGVRFLRDVQELRSFCDSKVCRSSIGTILFLLLAKGKDHNLSLF